MNLKVEGYWQERPGDGLPMPVSHPEAWDGQAEFLAKLKKCEAVAESVAYRGWSTCRVCRCHNGNAEFSLGGWRWPQGYRHYVEAHNVRPSEEFLKAVTASAAALAQTD